MLVSLCQRAEAGSIFFRLTSVPRPLFAPSKFGVVWGALWCGLAVACGGVDTTGMASAPEPKGDRFASAPQSAEEERKAARPGRSQEKERPRFFLLEVPGHLPAVVRPARGPLPEGGYPIAVAAHGAGGRAEHHCEYWDEILKEEVLLLCPQGTLLDAREQEGGAFYATHLALGQELDALLAAAHNYAAQEGDATFKVRAEDYLYLAYSQGATMGALALVGERPAFTKLVLVEGGAENFSLGRAKTFKDSGGLGVLLACGTPSCAKHARGAHSNLEKSGAAVVFVDVPGGGHIYFGKVGAAVQAHLPTFAPDFF